jgi:hypothetical protein
MTPLDADHITTIKINELYLKVALGRWLGSLDRCEAMRRIAPRPKNLMALSAERRKEFCSDSSLSRAIEKGQAVMGCRLRVGPVGNLQKVILRVEGGLCMVLIINADKNILMKYNGLLF